MTDECQESADDDREELKLRTFSDTSFGTRCVGGYKVKLTGSRGSSELNRSRVNRVGTSSQSHAARQSSTGRLPLVTSPL